MNMQQEKFATAIICKDCSTRFIFRRGLEEETALNREIHTPRICPECRKKYAARKREAKEAFDSKNRQEKRAREQEIFLEKLKGCRVVALGDIKTKENDTLFILGNGFDMMHRAKSSYYGFRDSMGKRNDLRNSLETLLTAEDIWADFEASLGRFNMQMMAGEFTVDTLLDVLGAYDEDAGAAEFFMAVETAARPITTIAYELPTRFREWVETLAVGTDDRPLSDIFCNGRVLSFNYTEFPEILYGISPDRICYIHGCRKNKEDLLILGHMTDSNSDVYDFKEKGKATHNKFRQGMIQIARQFITDLVSECDESLTKNCTGIIASNKEFFASLKGIKNIVTVGHSMSEVDMPYFSEIIKNTGIENVSWYIGCHCLGDFLHMESMLDRLKIPKENTRVFRTDTVSTRPKTEPVPEKKKAPAYREKGCGVSPEGTWRVTDKAGHMKIWDKNRKCVFDILLSQHIARIIFSEAENTLLVSTKGCDNGVFLFGFDGNGWSFCNELQSAPHQSIMNPRLRHVYLTDRAVTFVYNNRVREYSLSSGDMTLNLARRYNGNYRYEGRDIKELLSYR